MMILPNSLVEKKFLSSMEKLRYGTLRFVTPEGVTHEFKGSEAGPAGHWRIESWDVIKNALMRGDIALGEDYIAGLWESDHIEDLFSVLMLNMDELEDFAHGDWLRRMWFLLYNRVIRRNSKSGSSQNIKAHYDVGNDFYKLWLDPTMTYSSALYHEDTTSLEQAQRNKYGRIIHHLNDAQSVLEVGCGWGGFADQAAENGRNVTGLTVSPAQHAYAQERLGSRADIRIQDYRDTPGKFDSIVSIEMFEAVGERYWPHYFNMISQRLKQGGKAMIQTITIRDEFFDDYRTRSDFIRHYVFPGGMLPSVQRVKKEAVQAGLEVKEVFSFGQDYARTLREWIAQMEHNRDHIIDLGYNDAFIRNWRFYMSICAAAFAIDRTNVVQMDIQHA